MESKKQTKIAKWALIVSALSLITSIVISLFTFYKTNETSRQLLQYQLEQERLPRIMALNYELPVQISKINHYGRNHIDFSSIPDNLHPIKIPIYNVGVGLAQNCNIVWNKKSINDACIYIKGLLSQYYSIHEFEHSEIALEAAERWARKDFIFAKRDGVYDSVRYCAYYSSTNGTTEYDYELSESAIMCNDIQFPYILPVLNQTEPLYIPISNGLSMLLLEVANLQVCEPIQLCFDVNYQDLTGLSYSHSIEVTFLLCNQKRETHSCHFDVSFNVVDAYS